MEARVMTSALCKSRDFFVAFYFSLVYGVFMRIIPGGLLSSKGKLLYALQGKSEFIERCVTS